MTEAYRHPIDPETVEFFPSWGSVLALGQGDYADKVYSHSYNVDNLEIAQREIGIIINGLIEVTGPAVDRDNTLLEGKAIHKNSGVGIWTEVMNPNPKTFGREGVKNG